MIAALLLAPPTLIAQDFSAYWHDGYAELDGYRLTVSRYGEEREGWATMIYVTEPFSESKRVKVDDHTQNPEDNFDAIKLNLVRDFQTGIYDYNTMVSVFSRTSDFSPAKITFTSAEWCGHVYSELVFEKTKIKSSYFSYFEDESATRMLPNPKDLVSEDNLFILLRGLRGYYMPPGEAKTVDYLPGEFFSRLTHSKLDITKATISRRQGTEKIKVPAGEFAVVVYDISTDGRNGTFYIEEAYPHRVVKWKLSPDVKGELTGSKRLKYWGLNHNADEKYLKGLGLPVAVK